MTENHFWSHLLPFQINTQLWFFFYKRLPAAILVSQLFFFWFFFHNGCWRPFWKSDLGILDDWKSLSIAFLAISDQYSTFFSQTGCQRPFWMTENHFRSHFSPFQINTQLFFSIFFFQNGCRWPFGSPKITFDRISRHFRSILNFFFTNWLPAAILDDRKSLSIAFLAISDQYTTFFFDFFFQNGCRWPFGSPKITFDRISRHFRSILNFFIHKMHFSPFQIHTQFFFSKWLLAAILEVRFRPFWMTENHFWSHFSPFQINTQLFYSQNAFLAISDPYAIFLFQNGCWRPFWKSDLGHFGWPKITFNRISRHFILIFFFQNGYQRPFWMTENHFWSHFLPFQINTQLCFFFYKRLPAAILEVRKSLLIAFLAISDQ